MRRTLLVEIGTEELPPKALRQLSEALTANLCDGLANTGLEHGAVQRFSTPRRLAVRVAELAERQPDTQVERLGPAVAAAYDAAGHPTPAAVGFARSCGLSDPGELESVDTDKGPRLCFRALRPGAAAAELIPGLVTAALGDLPIPRRMRWGASREEFVRPVHWVVLLLGDQLIDAEILGVRSGRHTRGHRVHAPAEFVVTSPESYENQLEAAYVIPDFEARRTRIRSGVEALAASAGGRARIDPELLDEVTALNEWPVPLLGRFDEQFLAVPREALISSMQGHQKYFPVAAADDSLLPWFITVANLDSRQPEQVVAGNERVIRPRFTDAAFFWSSDLKTSLAARRERLRAIVYQGRLGSLFDKTARVASLAERLAPQVGADPSQAVRAAELAKSDLVSAMVEEFGELQGVMGRYYAAHDGEPTPVAEAIFEQYLPRHAGDALPATPLGVTLGLADRVDTLAGIFSIGGEPTGSRDPFALRRAAIAVLRILIDRELDLDLLALIETSTSCQPGCDNAEEVARKVFGYVIGRLRALGEEQGIVAEAWLAVSDLGIRSPLDLWRRMVATNAFIDHADAPSLIITDKRIANLLERADRAATVEPKCFTSAAETELWERLLQVQERVQGDAARGNYRTALEHLGALRSPVDRFFTEVMVMVDDAALRDNRLALLSALRQTFTAVADLSQLAARVGAQ